MVELIRVSGGNKLTGRIPVSGAKNAALPLMCAALLTDEPLVLENMPELDDIETLSKLISGHGGTVNADTSAKTVSLHLKDITSTTAPYELVSSMRASILVLGPLLAREHNARVALPGGCAIGTRPVDMHLDALERMGATFTQDGGDVVAEAKGGLKGARVRFEKVSVGATENTLMAATLAKGTTTIINAAREPEITDLAECLIKMGAKIEGLGTDRLTIEGVERLNGTNHQVVADRIEAGTFAMAAGITGGELFLENARLEHLVAAQDALSETNLKMSAETGGIRATSMGPTQGVNISTEPFPGFPTDLQAQFMALMTVAEGSSVISENIFENRFMHVPELQRLGANITIDGHNATIRGVGQLNGARVKATDLRASVAMVLAGLVASGDTFVSEVGHLDRGYEGLEAKLQAVGADIERVVV